MFPVDSETEGSCAPTYKTEELPLSQIMGLSFAAVETWKQQLHHGDYYYANRNTAKLCS